MSNELLDFSARIDAEFEVFEQPKKRKVFAFLFGFLYF